MSESFDCRLAALELFAEPKKHGYEGEWAIVVLAAAILAIAGAECERNEFLAWAAERYLEGKEWTSSSTVGGRKQ
jgi:hypothetical protein